MDTLLDAIYEDGSNLYNYLEQLYVLDVNGEKNSKKFEEIKRFKREWYNDTIYLPFEMIQCPVPAGYKGVLEGYYGKEYMTPLQVANAHGDLIIDTRHSYKEILKK